MRRKLPRFSYLGIVSLIMMPLFRISSAFSTFWLSRISQPIRNALRAISTRFSFPMFEIMGLGLIYYVLSKWIQKKYSHLLSMLLVLFSFYILLWYPAYWTNSSAVISESGNLESLCLSLIEELNQTQIPSPSADDAIQTAIQAVSVYTGSHLPKNAAKIARYPEWMRTFNLSGLYSPWTGEALIDGDTFPGALIFTVCHELMHGKGIADEGAANIAAWNACIAQGGEAAISANLWALRYAMPLLHESDENAWRACLRRMNWSTAFAFRAMNGHSEIVRASSPLLDLLGISDHTQNYDALIGYLTHGSE